MTIKQTRNPAIATPKALLYALLTTAGAILLLKMAYRWPDMQSLIVGSVAFFVVAFIVFHYIVPVARGQEFDHNGSFIK